jgi:hypothetical protein
LGKWTPEEYTKLIEAVKNHGTNWVAVAALVPGRTNDQCRQRWTSCLDPDIGKRSGKWTPEEDTKLIDAVKKHGKAWLAVADQVPGRTGKQCRLRWTRCLDPDIGKCLGKWRPEEYTKLIEAVKNHGTNWVVVAALVSSRTNDQCRQRWMLYLDPDIGKRSSKWTPEEDTKLIEAVKNHGTHWVVVAALVPSRTNDQCRQRWMLSLDPDIGKGKWNEEEDTNLNDAVKKHGTNWLAVAALVPGRTNNQCRSRWKLSLDLDIGKSLGKWTPEEDKKLIEAVKNHGTHWVVVAALVPGRTGKQCRRRWTLSLDPDIGKSSGKWTPEEDTKLIEAVENHGKNWVVVAALVSSRTNDQCRQRWMLSLDPDIGKSSGKWTQDEDTKLIEAVKNHGTHWVAVAALVPGRTNQTCRSRWTLSFDPDIGKSSGKWTPEEDRKLIEAVKNHGQNWVVIADHVPGRAIYQCRKRWTSSLDPDRASNTVEKDPDCRQ